MTAHLTGLVKWQCQTSFMGPQTCPHSSEVILGSRHVWLITDTSIKSGGFS